jgi:hypothetical protein
VLRIISRVWTEGTGELKMTFIQTEKTGRGTGWRTGIKIFTTLEIQLNS